MRDLVIRLATQSDIGELVEMRRDFTFEDIDPDERDTRPGYETDCRAFLADAITSGRWHIWVAEVDGQLVSHLFVALIEKVPRPVRENRRIAYLTNVYMRVAYRNQDIGSRLIKRAQKAAKDEGVELMVVWPSDESADFYTRHGFAAPEEPLIWEA